MKTFAYLLIAAIIMLLSSCSTTYLASGGDDVYYVPKTGEVVSPSSKPSADNYDVSTNTKPTTDYSTVYSDDPKAGKGNNQSGNASDSVYSEYYTDEAGNSYITNHYYGDYYEYDDYYDYAYTSRLRRFHSMPYCGFGYYHNYYTDLYWYTYDPFYYGVSIYFGYPWWYPSYYYYRPYNWYWGYGYGFGYYPFSSPWYSYGYGYGYYGNYYHGYWDGYHNYYYNSYDGTNGYYYGSRDYITSGDGAGRSSNEWFGARYESAMAAQSGRTDGRAASVVQQDGTSSEISREKLSDDARSKDASVTRNESIDPGKTNMDNANTPVTIDGRTATSKGISDNAADISQDRSRDMAVKNEPATPTRTQEARTPAVESTRNASANTTARPEYQRPITNQPVRERTYTPPAQTNPAQVRQPSNPPRSYQPVTTPGQQSINSGSRSQTPASNTSRTDSRQTTGTPTQTKPPINANEPVKTYSKPNTEASSSNSYRQPSNVSGNTGNRTQPVTQPAQTDQSRKTYTRPNNSSHQPSSYSRPSTPTPSTNTPSVRQGSTNNPPSSQNNSRPSSSNTRSSYSPGSSSHGSSGSNYSSGSSSRSSSSGSSYSSGSSSSRSSGTSSSSSSSSRSGSSGSSSVSGRRN